MNFTGITPDLLRQVTRIVTHADCADGIASAMLLHDALPEATVEFVQYNTPEWRDLAATPGMLFCDMIPGKRWMGFTYAVQSDGSMSLVFSLRSCGDTDVGASPRRMGAAATRRLLGSA
ncbi:MAG TPA: hypothetical protein VFB99_24365 [Vicinamibacterales bacterium]|nr:hypothetical protein [Vicinamibacterales bacterium]